MKRQGLDEVVLGDWLLAALYRLLDHWQAGLVLKQEHQGGVEEEEG